MMRRIRSILILPLLFAALGQAGASPPAVVSPSPAGPRLQVHGRLVTIFRESNAGLSPLERARLAAERLNALIGDGLTAGQVTLRSRGKDYAVYAAGQLLMIATEAEAKARRETAAATAGRWAGNLRAALGGRAERGTAERPAAAPPARAPELRFEQDRLVVPVEDSRTVSIRRSGFDRLDLEITEPAVASAEFISNGKAIRIKGVAPGDAAVRISGDGRSAEIPVQVRPYAGRLAGPATVKITGAGPERAILLQIARDAARERVRLEPGAQLRPGADPVSIASPAPGRSRTVLIPLVAEGSGLVRRAIQAPVTLIHTRLPGRNASRLLYSNHPESVTRHQTLFTGLAPGGQQTRLLYHHQNRTSSPYWFQVHLVNPGEEDLEVQIIAGEAGPFINPLQVGHRAAEKFLKAHDSRTGYIASVPARGTLLVMARSVPVPHTMSGIYDFNNLSSSPLIVHVAALSTVAAPEPAAEMILQAETQPHTYTTAEKPTTASYRVGGQWAFIPVGRRPIESPQSDKKLFGNYGVIYNAEVTVENPTDVSRKIEVVLNPEAGWARGIFEIEGRYVEAPQISPPAEAVLYSFQLPAGQSRRIRIRTIPVGGAAYPASVVVRS